MGQILGKRGKIDESRGKFVRSTSLIWNRPERKMVPKCFRPDTVEVHLIKVFGYFVIQGEQKLSCCYE